MKLDCHIHVFGDGPVEQKKLLSGMQKAGTNGGMILSIPPACFPFLFPGKISNKERLDNVLAWTSKQEYLFPFYWIDPLEKDALSQVEKAVKAGIAGFKVICNHFFPSDKRAMKVFKSIADHKKSILFHSGILWDGMVSSCFNRPGEFECLLEIDGLKFALAHVSWPWVDECIALYGKFQSAHDTRPNLAVEMFIDTTPGTPVIYRDEALTKIFTVGYDVADNVLFGTDTRADDFNVDWVRGWAKRDLGIHKKNKVPAATIEKVFSANLLRFVGATKGTKTFKTLAPGDSSLSTK